MGDLFLNMGQNRAARKLVGLLGVKTPQILARSSTPWEQQPLSGCTVGVGAASGGAVADLDEVLAGTGAERVAELCETGVEALVFDATGIRTVAELRALYDFFHPRIRSLAKCGRVVVLGRAVCDGDSPAQAAASHALIGFVKSVAKEVGRKGSTANLLCLEPGSDDQVAGPLRYLLTVRSAFVSGQVLRVRAGQSEPVWVRPLAGKTALVTGAVRGIGEATARRLAGEGARVLLLDLPGEAEGLQAMADELNGVAVPLDITAPDTAARLIEAAGGPLDIVVHNAGITRDKTLAKMSEAFWDLTLSVNLGSVLSVTEALLEQGGLADGGRVVLVSSVAGIAGNVGQTNYAASKSGIIGLTHSLGVQLADRGIMVNAIAPGFIETRLTHAIPFAIREVGRRLSNLNQGGLPLDIAEAVTFLSSPGAGGLRGQVLRVCGGNLLGA
jgi:3-oxoacyl-[acyl-carrier protein] reductase